MSWTNIEWDKNQSVQKFTGTNTVCDKNQSVQKFTRTNTVWDKWEKNKWDKHQVGKTLSTCHINGAALPCG